MEAQAINPDITIDKTELNFDECYVKERKLIKILITNKNTELSVDFCFNKIPHFKVEPNKGKIKPTIGDDIGQVSINVYFHPENIGKFNDVLIFKYINNMYEIPIKIYAICKGEKKYNYLRRMSSTTDIKTNNNHRYEQIFNLKKNNELSKVQIVPDEIAQDFTKKPYRRIDQSTRLKRLYKNQINQILQKMGQNINLKSLKPSSDINKNEQLIKYNHGNEILKKFNENFKIYEKLSNHRSLSNLELVKMRRARRLLRPMHIKNKSQISLFSDNNVSDNLLSLRGNRLDSPKLRLPTPKDKLWVASPIGQYESLAMEEYVKKDIGKTPDDMYDESM